MSTLHGMNARNSFDLAASYRRQAKFCLKAIRLASSKEAKSYWLSCYVTDLKTARQHAKDAANSIKLAKQGA